MKKRRVEQFEFVFSGEEVGSLKKCLDYISHRLAAHPECGIRGLVELQWVNKIRRELK